MLNNLLKKYRTIAVVANPNEGKSSLILGELIELRKETDKKKEVYNKLLSEYQEMAKTTSNPEFLAKFKDLRKITKYYNKFEIYCYGVEESLYPVLEENGIKIMHNSEDVKDTKVNTSLIFIDEINKLYDGKVANKKTKEFFKFINRIYHLNNYLIGTTAESGYWNKIMEDAFRCFIVKSIEYDSLVQRTKLKRRVEGIQSSSSYRLDIPKNTYYVINDDFTEKHTFEYNPTIDSKKDNISLFEDDEMEFKIETFKNKLSEGVGEVASDNPFNLPVKTIEEQLK